MKRLQTSRSHTLEKLCLEYCNYLDARGKVSAKKVRADLHRYVFSLPVSQKTAREATRADVAQLVLSIQESGKPRAAGMVRVYLSATYTLALGAEGDAHAPASLIPFGIESNPFLGVKAIKVAERTRHLSESELRAFMRRLREVPASLKTRLL